MSAQNDAYDTMRCSISDALEAFGELMTALENVTMSADEREAFNAIGKKLDAADLLCMELEVLELGQKRMDEIMESE